MAGFGEEALLHQLLAGNRLEILVEHFLRRRFLELERIQNVKRLAHIHGAALRIEWAVGGEHDLVNGEEFHAGLGRGHRGERSGVGPEILLEIIEHPLF